MGTTEGASTGTGKPLLSKRKAVRNLKELANSSIASVKSEPSTSTPAFFSEEKIPYKDPLMYENLKDNIGKKLSNYFLLTGELYLLQM
ncbi:hypothetical protein [Legionella tunisiensis]|uniref:hypothetical protein n=1 Tax=Legionella tunisiensis TaxID=1034944 RepID=UPI0012EA4040|nr:hypothetical protein [Legionella tunisiensis]